MPLRGWFQHVGRYAPSESPPPSTPVVRTTKQARYRARLQAAGRCERCGGVRPCERHRLDQRRRYSRRQVGALVDFAKAELRTRDPHDDEPQLSEEVFVLLVGTTRLRWKTLAYALGLDHGRARMLRDNLRQLAEQINLLQAWDEPGGAGDVYFALSYLVARGDVRYCGDDFWAAVRENGPAGPS